MYLILLPLFLSLAAPFCTAGAGHRLPGPGGGGGDITPPPWVVDCDILLWGCHS